MTWRGFSWLKKNMFWDLGASVVLPADCSPASPARLLVFMSDYIQHISPAQRPETC